MVLLWVLTLRHELSLAVDILVFRMLARHYSASIGNCSTPTITREGYLGDVLGRRFPKIDNQYQLRARIAKTQHNREKTETPPASVGSKQQLCTQTE